MQERKERKGLDSGSARIELLVDGRVTTLEPEALRLWLQVKLAPSAASTLLSVWQKRRGGSATLLAELAELLKLPLVAAVRLLYENGFAVNERKERGCVSWITPGRGGTKRNSKRLERFLSVKRAGSNLLVRLSELRKEELVGFDEEGWLDESTFMAHVINGEATYDVELSQGVLFVSLSWRTVQEATCLRCQETEPFPCTFPEKDTAPSKCKLYKRYKRVRVNT